MLNKDAMKKADTILDFTNDNINILGQFGYPYCGFSKNVSSEERVKPWLMFFPKDL